MKKAINLKRIFLLTLLFLLGTTKMCFADVYVSPTEDFIIIIPILAVVLAILAVVLVIDLVCMLVGKVKKSKELLSKTRKIGESIFYYILITLGLMEAAAVFVIEYPLCIIPFIIIFISLFFRLQKRNKQVSYAIIGLFVMAGSSFLL